MSCNCDSETANKLRKTFFVTNVIKLKINSINILVLFYEIKCFNQYN